MPRQQNSFVDTTTVLVVQVAIRSSFGPSSHSYTRRSLFIALYQHSVSTATALVLRSLLHEHHEITDQGPSEPSFLLSAGAPTPDEHLAISLLALVFGVVSLTWNRSAPQLSWLLAEEVPSISNNDPKQPTAQKT